MNNLTQLENLIIQQIDDFSLKNQMIMVALSGGIDSITLFDVLCKLKKRGKIQELSICHVNFGLRGKESDLDEQFVRDLAKNNNTNIFVHRIQSQHKKTDLQKKGESTQEWARRIRYEIFANYIKQGWTIALAHHIDDLAENILLRMSRGTSLIGLSGMSTYNFSYWRPFLELQKSDLKKWAQRHNLPHREDSSNAKMDYSRNIIRNKVLVELNKLYPKASHHIARLGEEAKQVSSYARQTAIKRLRENVVIKQNGSIQIQISEFSHLPDAIIKDLIAAIIQGENFSERTNTLEPNTKIVIPESSFLELALDSIRSWNSKPDSTQKAWSTMCAGGGAINIKGNVFEYMPNANPKTKLVYNLGQFKTNILLEGFAKIEIAGKNQDFLSIQNKEHKALRLCIESPVGNSKIKFNKNTKNVSFNELMRTFNIPISQRGDWLLISCDEKLICCISKEACIDASGKTNRAQYYTNEIKIEVL
ncbi:MAG: tRNA lysidine(34) synthetase TilS [Bdellovibrionota bacterium]